MLRKTEVNLLRLQCSFTEQRYSVSNSNREPFKSPRSEEMQKKLYEEKEPANPAWNSNQELEDIKKGFEKVVQSKIKEQQNSLDYFTDKIAGLEGDSEDLQKFRGNIEEKIRAVEIRCKEQIGEIEGFCRQFVNAEEITKLVDEVRGKGLELAKRMQKEVDDAKVVGNEERDRAVSQIESKVQERMRLLVSKSEFFKGKESLEQGIDELVRECEGNIEGRIERMKKGYKKSCKSLENELGECENGINSVTEVLNSRLETIEESVSETKKQHLDGFRGLRSDIKRIEGLTDTSSLDDRIKLLEKKYKAIPKAPEIDLSEFAEKSELNFWVSKYEKVLKEKKNLELRIDDLEQKLVQIEAKIQKQKKQKKRKNNLKITREFSIEGISTFGKPGFLGNSSLKADFSFAVQTFSSDILNFSLKRLDKIEEVNIILTPNISEKQYNEPKNEEFFNLIEFNHSEIKDFPVIGKDVIFTPSLPKNEVFSELIEFNQENEIKDFPIIGKNINGSLSNSSNSNRSAAKSNPKIDKILKPPSKNMNLIKGFETNKYDLDINEECFENKINDQEIGEKDLVEDAFNEFVEDEIGFCCTMFKANMYPLQDVAKISNEKVNRFKKNEMNWMEVDFSSGSEEDEEEEEESESSSSYLDLFKKK